MEDRVLFQSEGMGLFGMGERKRDFNRIFKTIRRMKCGDNQEKRAKNGILFFLLLLLSREFFGSMRSISIERGSRIFPVLLNPRARRCAFTKVEEPVGTIRRKRPKDRDARKESNRGEGRGRREREKREEGEERRGETRRERTSRSLMGYPPRTSCNVIVGDHSMDELSFESRGYLNARFAFID